MFKRIPILMYHSIEPRRSQRITGAERFYNITPEDFTTHMVCLKTHGYTTISSNDLLLSDRDEQLPERPVLLTFDDGYISHYDTVLPVLKKAGFKAAFFLVVNDIGGRNRMNWTHVRELVHDSMEIGSQGMNHEFLNKASYTKLITELKASRITLEEELGTEIIAFSIPYGLYSQRISNVARGMGYKLVFTSFAGDASVRSDQYCIRRIAMRQIYSMRDFMAVIGHDPVFMLKRQIEELAKDSLKAAIGVMRYNELKENIFSRLYQKA